MIPKMTFGSVHMDYYEPVSGEFYEPVSGDFYGVQSWSPMIPESYPGLFWDPATGKMSSQKEIMSRLKWPTMGGIPYQYNPPRPRGFLGMEYPLVQTNSGAQWGYGALPTGPVTPMGPSSSGYLSESFMKSYYTSLGEQATREKVPVEPVARANFVVSKIRVESSLTAPQKIQLLSYFMEGLERAPFQSKAEAISIIKSEISSLSVPVVLGMVAAGIAVVGVVGYMMYRRNKK